MKQELVSEEDNEHAISEIARTECERNPRRRQFESRERLFQLGRVQGELRARPVHKELVLGVLEREAILAKRFQYAGVETS